MNGTDLKRIREFLGMTPSQLAPLLGVHTSTIYRGENQGEKAILTAHMTSLLGAFEIAEKKRPGIANKACDLLHTDGVPRAMLELLFARYEP